MNPGIRLHEVDRVSSTQTRLAARVRQGRAGAGDALRADLQTEGRGRSGGSWRSDAGGGVWLSVVLGAPRLDAPGVLPLSLGLAVARAVEALEPRASLLVKWPNDLFVELSGEEGGGWRGTGAGKVGGILCELVHPPLGAPVVVAGIGLNLRAPSGPGLSGTAGLDRVLDPCPTPGGLARVLLPGLEPLVAGAPARLSHEDLEELHRRSLLRGRRVEVGGHSGRVEGVDAHGALLLEDASGTRRILGGSLRPLLGTPHGPARPVEVDGEGRHPPPAPAAEPRTPSTPAGGIR